MLWIRIGSDPYHFVGIGSCQIRLILPDSDWDLHPGHADPDRYLYKAPVFFRFFQKFPVCLPNTFNHDTFASDEKGKTQNSVTGIDVNKSNFFPTI